MNYQDYLGDDFNPETGELNTDKVRKSVLARKDQVNILLMGATGVGKSALINAIFGSKVVESGAGKPVTQHLNKVKIKEKGITLWDTKGIESKDYEATKKQLINDIETAFRNVDKSEYPDVAWLCIKESTKRIEERDFDLLKLAQQHGIPTVIVFTDTRFEETDKFVQDAQTLFTERYAAFIKNRYARVNSVEFSFLGHKVPTHGLENLLTLTEGCLIDSEKNGEKKRLAFLKAQEVENRKRLEAMISGARDAVHIAAVAAGGVGAVPIPFADAPIIAGIQAKMIHSINAEFELKGEEATMTSIVTGILGITAVAQAGKAIVSGLLKFVPFAGSVVSAATAVALTEAIGHAYIEVLSRYYNEKTAQVELPANTAIVLSLFKDFFKKP